MSKKGKLVFGVGINDADYVVQRKDAFRENGKLKRKLIWRCPYYSKWQSMLTRCYSAKYQEDCPTYKGCYVCDEWLTFSNFKRWMESQDWKGLHLDKDILVNGNREYSPDKCVFVNRTVNLFLTERGAARGDFLIGVHFRPDCKGRPYIAQCGTPFAKGQEYLGCFDTEQEAHEAYKKRKYELAIELANSEYVKDERVRKALIDRFKL